MMAAMQPPPAPQATKVPRAATIPMQPLAQPRSTRSGRGVACCAALATATVARSCRRRLRKNLCYTSSPMSLQACALELPELTADEARQLGEGLRVQRQERSGGTGHGFVVVDVEAPASLVLQCLESFKDYPNMIPVVRKAEVLSLVDETGGCTAKCSYRISKFWLGIHARHSVDRAEKTLSFELDETGPRLVLHEASGYWHVQAQGLEESRVWLCVTRLRASPLVPKCIIDYAADRALRRATCWLQPVLGARWGQMRQSKAETSDEAPTRAVVPSTFCAA
eukprot:s1635_g4.t1